MEKAVKKAGEKRNLMMGLLSCGSDGDFGNMLRGKALFTLTTTGGCNSLKLGQNFLLRTDLVKPSALSPTSF